MKIFDPNPNATTDSLSPYQRNDNDFQDRSNDNPAGRIQRTCKGNTQYNTIQYNREIDWE